MKIQILHNAGSIFGSSFEYHRQMVDPTKRHITLEFSAMVEEIPCQGVDMLTLSEDGTLITDFKV